jgi:hypothetical protein
MMTRALVAAVMLGASACATSTHVVVLASRTLEAPAGGEATLVVGDFWGWRAVNLLDETGNVVGQLSGRSVIAINRKPGRFVLYAVPDADGARGDRIEGVLSGGQIYFAAVGVRYGGLSLTRSERFDEALDAVMLGDSGRSALQQELGDTRELVAKVDEAVGAFDPARQQARHVEGKDGYGTLNVPEVATADVYRP